MGDVTERWHLAREGHEHIVEVAKGALVREVVWTRDGAELGRKKTSDETIVVAPKDEDAALRLKFGMVGPARRVTLHDSEPEAHTGLGGTDFEPEAGSKAAARAEWIGRHPHLHTVRQTAVAAAGVGVPVLVIWLLTLVPWPSVDIPMPDLPSIPWPDLPSIPWPDINLPSVPWPDLPNLPSLPEWTEPVRKFLVPIIIAFFIARGEVKRRRKVEAEKAEQAEKAKKAQAEHAPGAALHGESPGDSPDSGA